MSGNRDMEISPKKHWMLVILVSAMIQLVRASEKEEIPLRAFPATTLHGVFSGDDAETDFDVVHPVRLDDRGQFLSHDVRYVDPIPDIKSSPRKRRHADLNRFSKRASRLLYSVPFDDGVITLNLTANEKLLRDDFIVERIKSGNKSIGAGITSHMTRGTKWPCHFRGHVEGQSDSKVALSTCHGLTGLLITEKGDYFIEPLAVPKVDSELSGENVKSQPHKIYRRDLGSVIDKAEPLLHLKKLVSDAKHMKSNNPLTKREHGNQQNKESDMWPNSVFDDSQHEFCGVADTRRKYRRTIKKREQWESHRHHGQFPTVHGDEDRHSRRKVNSRRPKRSVSVERMIEMLVVVDKKMVDYYEAYDDGNVERYVLTIINMVSELFHDASIGNSLHVSLVRLILLEEEEKGLKITQQAEYTLDSFCKWARKINPKGDEHPNHHDVAVLLTRRDICSKSNKSCETLGLAHVAGMCQSHRSCNVNQDTGLSLAFTVAHELGHNFAMHHDGQMNDCKSSSKYNYVMAPHLTSSSLAMRWSSCSRRYITRFLDRNWGFCLNDQPADHDQFEMPTTLPGVVYDADHQCRLMFGEKSRHCFGIDDMCDRLWCYVGGTCRSRLHAAAAGTKCGKGKWCFEGKCVRVGKRPGAVNGGWGDWSSWSGCSRTCGLGVSYSMRHCDHPTPQNGGKYCLGERKRYRTCSKWKCQASKSALSFREQQCAAFNNVKYRNTTFNWKPVDSPLYPCELHCYTKAGSVPFADRLRDKVVDGTRCFPGSSDICVDGICRRVGCDKNIGSRAREDRCGVCHGNGSSCYEVKKKFIRKKGEEYSPVALLTRGARNIEIEEISSASNFLALRNATNKTHFFLNGNYMIQWDTKFQLAGTQFTYRRVNETQDMISAPGPLTHDIMVMLLYVEENPGVSVSYTVPYNVTHAFSRHDDYPEFRWKIKDWTKCSLECGKGHQTLSPFCEEAKAGPVEDFYCNKTMRPPEKRQTCNDVPCPPRWWAGPWQPCSVSCGGGVGVQHRMVMCVRAVGEDEQIALNHTDCSDSVRPTNKQRCSPTSEIPCPAWRADEWNECSATCGGGVSNRTVRCVTYVMNDVITLGDLGDSNLFDIELDDLKGDQNKTPNKTHAPPQVENISISHKISENEEETLNGMGLSIEADPLEHGFDEDGYDVEEDNLCDSASKPISIKPCNTYTCPEVTSSARETETPTVISTEYISTKLIPEDETELPTSAGKPSTTHVAKDMKSTSDLRTPTIPDTRTTNQPESGNSSADMTNVPVGVLSPFHRDDVTNEDFDADGDFTPDPGTEVTPPVDEFDLDMDADESPVLNVQKDMGNIELDSASDDSDEFDIGGVTSQPKRASPGLTTFQPDAVDDSPSSDTMTANSTTAISDQIPKGFVQNVTKVVDPEVLPHPEERLEPETTPGEPDIKQPGVQRDTGPGRLEKKQAPVVPKLRAIFDNFDIEIKGTTKTTEMPKSETQHKRKHDKTTTTATTTDVSTDSRISNTTPTTTKSSTPTSRPIIGEWIVGNWSECSTTCGVGAKIRVVRCGAHDERFCDQSRPVPAKICNLGPCAKWVYGGWDKCSTLCGSGTKVKKTECVDERTEKVLRPHHCRFLPTLTTVRISCRENQCWPWKTSRWTSCSRLCGPGIQRRRTACSRRNQCDLALKPHDRKSCYLKKCVQWKTMEWDKCSVHCGGGLQHREVICIEVATGNTTSTSECNLSLKPKRTKKCNMGQCPATDYDFSSCHANRLSSSFCHLLQQRGKCVQPSVAIQCCVTCKTFLSVRHKDKIS